MRAAMLERIGVHDSFPNDRAVHATAEHIVFQLERADFLVVRVDDVDLHYFFPFGFSTCATFSFFAVMALRIIT